MSLKMNTLERVRKTKIHLDVLSFIVDLIIQVVFMGFYSYLIYLSRDDGMLVLLYSMILGLGGIYLIIDIVDYIIGYKVEKKILKKVLKYFKYLIRTLALILTLINFNGKGLDSFSMITIYIAFGLLIGQIIFDVVLIIIKLHLNKEALEFKDRYDGRTIKVKK